MLSIYMILVPLLAFLAYQDFKARRVSLVLFILVFLALAVNALKVQETFRTVLTTFLINSSFVSVQLICVKLYFVLKNKKNVAIIDTQIGSGDVLFFFVATLAFSTANFIAFYFISLVTALITALVYKGVKGAKHFEIPLAGIMSAVMACCVLCKLVNTNFNLYNDHVILNLFHIQLV